MKAHNLFFNYLLCSSIFLLIGTEVVHCHRHQHYYGTKKLFVFGDSYADTGNDRNPNADSWREPYGITFPNKPSGRFSDGRIFTDFLAKSLGLKSPVAYQSREIRASKLRYGMNFAFGGTGVFDTGAPYPNMTTQIDIFQGLLNKSIFNHWDLKNSIAHLSLVGNDYSKFLANGGSAEDLPSFIPQVVNQLVVNLQRIYSLGIKRISVTTLQPIGCLPRNTFATSFQQCNSVFNKAASFHNLLLQQAVSKMNNQMKDSLASPFIVFDLFNSFTSVIEEKGVSQGNFVFANLLKPCCFGVNQTFSCGSVDGNGNKMYTLCNDPKSHFFWDSSHPTQAGWQAIAYSLQPTIQQLSK